MNRATLKAEIVALGCRKDVAENIINKIPDPIDEASATFFTKFVEWWLNGRQNSGMCEVEKLYDDLIGRQGFQELVIDIVEIIGKQI